jgi:hypothetical protein
MARRCGADENVVAPWRACVPPRRAERAPAVSSAAPAAQAIEAMAIDFRLVRDLDDDNGRSR